jgi:hypothetical protein
MKERVNGVDEDKEGRVTRGRVTCQEEDKGKPLQIRIM